ncbi:MAG: hypothetical protein ACN2B6_10280 [Rickettsiales bacterium]
MMTSTKLYLSALSSFLIGTTSYASMVSAGEFTGYVALEHRQFFQEDSYAGQKFGSTPSVIVEPEYYHVSDDEKNTYTARVFIHLDPSDDERTHYDIRQLDWIRADDDWEIRAGISKVYWGVTESRHLVDIINQVDGVEDIDDEDRLGQPMVQLATFQDWGTLRFFYLPYFRERTFPGRAGRLRGPLVVDTDQARYANGAKEWHPDMALRYQHTIDAWDVGLAHFHGTSREPVLRIENGVLVPFYEIIDQSSLDVQYTTGSWLWKLEAIGRAGQGDYFGAATGGFEYTFYGVNDAHDLGILLEYHRDGRDHRAPGTNLDNDIFAGFRYTFNDVSDTELLAGITADTNHASQFVVLEASHRINTNWKAEIDARFFVNQDAESPAKPLDQDDFAQFRLSRYF